MTSHGPFTYRQALDFWFGRVNFELASPRPADLRLDRIRALLGLLGDPHRRLRVVHVAGSKGKGSTAALLASVLGRAGYRTGLFTSPHLSRVEERVQVDGRPISADELTGLLDEVGHALGRGRERLEPTFFEVATALGFLHFVRRRVDVAVIEVGLGGRFDSTNVCVPELAVITSISYDHTQQLGDRLASIAFEKAGIVKPGRPAVSGATVPEARAVIERVCRERGSPLRQLGVDFRYRHEPGQVQKAEGRRQQAASSKQKAEGNDPLPTAYCLLPTGERPRVWVATARGDWPALEVGLLGEHQAANAAVAVACVEELRAGGWHVPDAAVARGLAEVRWPARMEVVGRRPFVVLDCAHNVASAAALVETLRSSFPPARRLLVFAASADKDLGGMFRVLAPHFVHVFLTRYTSSARCAAPEQLGELLRRNGGASFGTHPTPAEALAAARAAAGPDDLVCVAGSVFLAGELRPTLVGP